MDKSEEIDVSVLKENFHTQLSELEMLQSVFCNPGEIQLDDYSAIADMQDYIDDKTTLLPSLLNYNVNLKVDSLELCLCVTLSHKYPMEKPDIFVRINNQNRTQQQKLNKGVDFYATEIANDDICIYSIITWLQENAPNYIDAETENNSTISETIPDPDGCARYWIYSHHIYSKMKRREIQSLANSYSLTGFCLPGKPGVMCVEGYASDCNTFWSFIRSMTWKKIVVKEIETDKSIDVKKFRKFKTFEEIAFQNEHTRINHMDMGEFNAYLESHNCEYIFKDLFGIDAKNTT